jgi:hypothetical protein
MGTGRVIVRTSLLVAAHLAAGVGISLGVAWMAASKAGPRPSYDSDPPWQSGNGWLWTERASRSGPMRVVVVRAREAIPRMPGVSPVNLPPPSWSATAVPIPNPAPLYLYEAAAGWPCPCMYARGWFWSTDGSMSFPKCQPEAGGPLAAAMVPGKADFPSATREKLRAAPLAFLWSGLAMDAAVWGAALSCLTVLMPLGLLRLRGVKRRRGGRCVRCGYDRTGLTPTDLCPECAART